MNPGLLQPRSLYVVKKIEINNNVETIYLNIRFS